jgi:hypothetical protein
MPVARSGENLALGIHLNLIGHAESRGLKAIEMRLDMSRYKFREKEVIGIEKGYEFATDIAQGRKVVTHLTNIGIATDQLKKRILRFSQFGFNDRQGVVCRSAFQDEALDIAIILLIDRSYAASDELCIIVIENNDRYQRRQRIRGQLLGCETIAH